jgi:hypothetical protein
MPGLHSADFELVERDSAMPGLGPVLDPCRLVEALGQDAFPTPPDDIRLDYVRYRPGRDCIGRYRISVDGDQRLAYAKTFAGHSLQKLEKAAKRPGVDGPHGRGRMVAPECALLFCWFPNDRKLRSIERLGESAMRERLIGRIFKQDETWLDADMAVLNYKPEKRLVVRLTHSADLSATVKFYTQAEFARTAHLRRDLKFAAELPTPRYIGGSKKHRVHAFRWLPGRSLREFSLDPTGDPVWHLRTGHLLAKLHARPSAPSAQETALSRAREARTAAEIIAWLLPDLGPAAMECARILGRFSQGVRSDECPVHADFYDKQVIVGSTRLAVIDLDQARMGIAAEDLGCFIAHLEYLVLSTPDLSADRAEQLGQCLLDGYGEAGGRCDEQQLAAWTAMALLRLARQPFRDRLGGWPDLVHALVARVQSLLTSAGLTA